MRDRPESAGAQRRTRGTVQRRTRRTVQRPGAMAGLVAGPALAGVCALAVWTAPASAAPSSPSGTPGATTVRIHDDGTAGTQGTVTVLPAVRTR